MSSLLRKSLVALGVLVLLLGAACGYFVYAPAPDEPTLNAQIQEKTIHVGGRTRTYQAYVPAKLPANPAIVLVLHGSNIDGATIRKWTGYEFDQMADRHGFIALYPDGYGKNWNDCRRDAPFAAKKENVDDVGFLRALVRAYRQANGARPAKVFVFGYSNGGQLGFRLAIEQPRFVTAVAAVAANLPIEQQFSCDWQSPTAPVMLVSNTADRIVPYAGGNVRLFGTSHGTALSARATAEAFARRNGLTDQPVAININAAPGNRPMPVSGLRWSRPTGTQAGQPVVEWYTVLGGGHSVPQPRFCFPRILGATATNLDTPIQALTFFGLVNTSSAPTSVKPSPKQP